MDNQSRYTRRTLKLLVLGFLLQWALVGTSGAYVLNRTYYSVTNANACSLDWAYSIKVVSGSSLSWGYISSSTRTTGACWSYSQGLVGPAPSSVSFHVQSCGNSNQTNCGDANGYMDWYVTVYINQNHTPSITVTPATQTVNEGVTATTQISTSDADNDRVSLTYTHHHFATISYPTSGGGQYKVRGRVNRGTYSDIFNVRACDSQSCSSTSTGRIQINNVNQPPSAQNITITTTEDTWSPLGDTHATDPDGDPITVQVTSKPSGWQTQISGTKIKFLPATNYSGTETLKYKVCDNHNACSGNYSLTATVIADNDPPTAQNITNTSDEDTWSSYVDTHAADADGDPITIQIVSSPTASWSTQTNGTSIRYLPPPDYNGTAALTFKACDNHNACSAEYQFDVTVNPVNDPPKNRSGYSTYADAGIWSNWLHITPDDPDGSAPYSLVLHQGPSHGQVELDSLPASNPSIPSPYVRVRYKGDAASSGGDSFFLKICDAAGACSPAFMVYMDVNGVPSGQDVSITVPENQWSSNTGVGANDPDSDDMYIQFVASPSHGSVSATATSRWNAAQVPTIKYKGNPNYFGGDTFTYKVCDQGGLCSVEYTATVTVTEVNDPPAAQDLNVVVTEDSTGDEWDIGASDVDSTFVTGVIVTQPSHGTPRAPYKKLNSCSGSCGQLNGSYYVGYTPDSDYYGTDSFEYKICDDKGTCAQKYTVTIAVNGVNDAPVFDDFTISTGEDTASQPYTLNATDVDATDVITYTIKNGDNADPAHGVASITGDQVSFIPHFDWNGSTTFKVTACDNNSTGTLNPGVPACTVATGTVTVRPQNDAPTAKDISVAATEDQPSVVDIDAYDADSTSVTGQIVTQPTHGTVTAPSKHTDSCMNPCGQIDGAYVVAYTPDKDYYGPDSFEYKICDDQGACSPTYAATVDVAPVNDPPQAADLEFLAKKGMQTGWKAPIVLDPDPNQTFTLSIVWHGTNLTPTVDPTGTRISALPSPSFSGNTSFKYNVCDQDNACLMAEAKVTVLDNINHKDGPSGQADIALVSGGYPKLSTTEYPVTSERAFRIAASGEKLDLTGSYNLELIWTTSTGVALNINGTTVPANGAAGITGYDFAAHDGRLVLPTRFEGLPMYLSPGYVGDLLVRVLNPSTGNEYSDIPNILIPISAWSVGDAVDFVLQRASDPSGAVAKYVEQVNITAVAGKTSRCADLNGGKILGWDLGQSQVYQGVQSCGIIWQHLPDGIESFSAMSPSLNGRFTNPANPSYEQVAWESGIIQTTDDGAVIFLPSISTPTTRYYTIPLMEPVAPTIDFKPTSDLNAWVDWVPSGYWPAPIGDGKLAGVVIGSTDYSGIVLDVTTRGTTTTKTSLGGLVTRAVNTYLSSIEDVMSVQAEASYLHYPGLTASLNLQFMATPDKPTLFVDRVTEARTDQPLRITGRIGQYDRATQQVAYDKDKFGRWTARLYQVTNKGHKTQRGTPIFTDSNTGEFTLSTPVTADMGPRARFVVEITMLRKDGTENPDAVIYSSPMNVAIRDAAPIDIEVSARRETGPAPFTAAVVVRPVDRSRHADIGEIHWEYSTDGTNFLEIQDLPQRVLGISQRIENPGKRWYRARAVNRYSNRISISNTVEVQAYRTPKIEISGYRRTFIGHPVVWTATNASGDPADYTWEVYAQSLKGGSATMQTGDTITLDANKAGRVFVKLTATPRDSSNIVQSKKVIIQALAVQPPYLRRPAVSGPRYAEVDQTYTFKATNGPIFYGADTDMTLSSEWELPNGAIVPGDTVDYTIQSGDEMLKYRVWINGYKNETLVEVEKTFYAWEYEWPENWEIVTRNTEVIVPARVVLFTQTSPKADIRKMGLEKPIYHYNVPPTAIKTFEYGNRLVVDFTKPGTYPIEAIIEDQRGNQELAVIDITVKDPPPLTSEINVNINDRWGRALALVTPRLVLHNPVSGEKVTSHKVYLDGQLVSDKASVYVSPIMVEDTGTHEIISEITMDTGRSATASKIFELIEGDLPQCAIQYMEYPSYTTVQLRCSTTMGHVKRAEWFATYDDTNTEQLGLTGFYGIFRENQLARGIRSLRIMIYNDKGQVTEINSNFP
ncbi:Ig-like domain-containing protein [Thiolapillus sp.]|uniref:Ig-like domain-containing protein n=1 Tax=Thiolapillus sp. TaxID=2017437 RepID=UPI003AF9FAB9